MEQTQNYKLKKPAPEDFYNVADQNENMDLIDAALNAHDSALAGKAGLDETGKVPLEQLPKISSLELGETDRTAYRGDRGKLAYEHSMDGNRHITAEERQKLAGLENYDPSAVEADILELRSGKADKAEVEAGLAGKADLVGGKVPAGQLPEMDYDPAGSAAAVQAAVQANLDSHTGDAERHWTSKDRVEMDTMREAVFANVTSNPFSVIFSDLEGITLSKGNWNEAEARLEW